MGNSLAAYLNLPPPVTTYNDHLKLILAASETVAKTSMIKAAEEPKEHYKSFDIAVSVDGKWRFSSKNGIVTVITNLGKHQANKVIDTKVMSTFYPVCTQMNNQNTKLSKLVTLHNCAANHQGSAGKMEADGALVCFERSESFYGLQ